MANNVEKDGTIIYSKP